jgi:hypothetical protein
MRAFFAEGQIENEDGDKLTLVCDFYTIDVAEQITGQRWDDILPELFNSRALATKVLYSLLRRKHEGITLDEAAALLFDRNSAAIWAVMGDVIRRACNIPDEPEADDAKKKPRGRSRSSAKSG